MVLDSVDHSTLPSSEKSAIRRFYEKIAPRAQAAVYSAGHKVGLSTHTITRGAGVLRSMSETAIVAGGLGVLDAKVGLDVNVPIGGGFKVPVDGLASLMAFGASLHPAVASVAEDLDRVGIITGASWAQRTAKEWASGASSAPAATSTAPAASTASGEDQVLSWARQQG